MSFAVSNIIAGLVVALTFSISTASCSRIRSQSQEQTAKPSPTSSEAAEKPSRSDSRIAIPEIKGCSRDQTSFYKGKVLSFLRKEKSIEITIRTEWDTTEKLVQTNADSIEYRRKGQPLKDEESKQIESLLSENSQRVGVTVWVCNPGDKQQIKIIDWDPPAIK
jgi:hypothetical protein